MSVAKTFYYSTDAEQLSFIVKVKLSTECRLFFWLKDIPEEILKASNNGRLGGSKKYFHDWDEAEKYIENMIQVYEALFLEETRTKVICYCLEINGRSHGEGQGIKLDFRILDRVELGDETIYQERYSRKWGHSSEHTTRVVHNVFDEEFKEMLWTEKREQFFQSIVDSLKSLSRAIEKGLSKKPELLAKQIESGAISLIQGHNNQALNKGA